MAEQEFLFEAGGWEIFVKDLIGEGSRIIYGVDQKTGQVFLLPGDYAALKIIREPCILYVKNTAFAKDAIRSRRIQDDDGDFFYAIDLRRGEGHIRILTRVLVEKDVHSVYCSIAYVSLFFDADDRPVKPSPELKRYYQRMTSYAKRDSKKITSPSGRIAWAKNSILVDMKEKNIDAVKLIWS